MKAILISLLTLLLSACASNGSLPGYGYGGMPSYSTSDGKGGTIGTIYQSIYAYGNSIHTSTSTSFWNLFGTGSSASFGTSW
jgi:hypothetical protein